MIAGVVGRAGHRAGLVRERRAGGTPDSMRFAPVFVSSHQSSCEVVARRRETVAARARKAKQLGHRDRRRRVARIDGVFLDAARLVESAVICFSERSTLMPPTPSAAGARHGARSADQLHQVSAAVLSLTPTVW